MIRYVGILSVFFPFILIISQREGKKTASPGLIVDGTNASHDEFPYIVGIAEKKEGKDHIIAAGSFLSEGWIITAQRVVFDDNSGTDKEIEILPKYDNRAEKMPSRMLKRFHASKRFCPPKKGDDTSELRDIALLKLKESIPFNKPPGNFKKIQIQDKWDWSSDIWTAGWGYTRVKNGSHPSILLKGSLKQFPKTCLPQCEILINYKNESDANICLEDAGGPAVIRKKGSNDELIGLITMNESPCSIEGTFTNLTVYQEWIKDTMKNEPDKFLCGKDRPKK